MKSRAIILIVAFCTSIVSCTNKQKQQNTIIGGADGSTEIVIAEDTQSTKRRENGWYYIVEMNQDSLSSEPIITVKEFDCLRLDTDTFGTYSITGTVSKHRQKKWANATERAIGKHIAFVFNDLVVSAPQVNQRIGSGNFQISVPRRSSFDLPAIYQQLRKEKIDSIDVLFHGWYIDSTYTSQEQDSLKMEIDYWEAKAWIELMSKPDEHYWYSIKDTAKYKSLEKALYEELQKGDVSSRASDYMKSGAYKKYKQYIATNHEYINLMFQGFLLRTSKGLNGYLVDDIIQSIYPKAPSIRDFVYKTDNEDDEKWAIYEWQKKIWLLMNNEKKMREENV